MNFVPINGLGLLAAETGLLVAFTILSLSILRFARVSPARPVWLNAILAKDWRSVLLVIGVVLVGRAVLLPWIGVPQPRINDEYSYLLMGDTFAHYRLTNPTPAAWPHFETFHVNMIPTYHSKYPVAQGVFLAFGEIVFHQPWFGVYLSTALLCGAICWTLQSFVPPGWALLGGLLAAVRIAFFSYWMNSYWGGSLAALGGALSLGSVVRLFEGTQSDRSRAMLAAVFASSLLLLATSRPYEGLAFSLPLLGYFVYMLVRGLRRHELTVRSTVGPFVVIGMTGLIMMGCYNQRTTGSALLLPHLLNERTYSPLPLFFWQQPRSNMRFHDPVFAKFFSVTEDEYKYEQTKSLSGLLSVEVERFLTDWFFYIGVALSLPVVIGLLSSIKQPKMRVVVLVAFSTVIALILCIYSMPHYAAPATVTVYVFGVEGLRYLWEQRRGGEQSFVIAVCVTVLVSSLTRQTGATSLNSRYALPNTRASVARQLQQYAGKQLVLVSYDLARHYPGDELVHNGADLSTAIVLWARSKGHGNDSDLCQAYADRTFWKLETDDVRYSLNPIVLCQTQQSHNR